MATATAAPAPTHAPATSRRLAGKIALTPGGNSGIGLAPAEEFLRAGARVAITGRDATTLESAAAELGELAAPEDLIALRGDVTVPAELDHVMSEVRRNFGRLDVLFVNAGIGQFLPIAGRSGPAVRPAR